ncbi:EpsG family protein [Sphingobacterium faecium]|uniref:EpsG family protein n=1 Tax=Sphingobacterium TaxID=28453 RepID=UPI00161D9CB2|nr:MULTISPECIES: EpsG family protein [Sphingobacterium]MBB2954365.1 hypothetical protein [Sphingobacterium sp. JUb56]UXD69337.1 EpsG family protein [Sphingobacterium faecium]
MDNLSGQKHLLGKKLFLIWIYIFLCFGYTIGTDWRHYEQLYTYEYDKNLLDKDYEKGFYYLIYLVRKFIPDFWLFLGIIKCVYLYSVLKFVRRFTTSEFVALAIMLNYNLLFMLVDNPLRFMTGSIILVLATGYLIDRKYLKFISVALLCLFFHISLIIPIALSLLVIFREKIINKSNTTLFVWYFFACLVSLFPHIINQFSSFFASKFPAIAYKLLNIYVAESSDAVFTLGSLIMFFLFFVLLHHKKIILENKYGDILFFFALFYMFLSRILMVFPTGFRLTLYFGLFFAVCLVIIIKSTSFKFKYILYLLIGLTIFKTLWTSYQYIPYTNSIYYILSADHLPRNYRDEFNKKEYNKRTGETIKDQSRNYSN